MRYLQQVTQCWGRIENFNDSKRLYQASVVGSVVDYYSTHIFAYIELYIGYIQGLVSQLLSWSNVAVVEVRRRSGELRPHRLLLPYI